MDKYKKGIRTFSVLLMGLSCLLLASFTTYKSCKAANENGLFIKEQIQLAMEAPDFEKSKYFTFKALRAMYSTKKNYKDCGCKDASKQLDLAEQSLRNVIKSNGMEDARIFLDIGIKNMSICLDILKRFDENEVKSNYDHNLLVLNTVGSDPGNRLEQPENIEVWETLEPTLNKLHTSINAVANTLDCEEAKEYIQKVQTENRQLLKNPKLSELRLYYYRSIHQITQNALLKIGACN